MKSMKVSLLTASTLMIAGATALAGAARAEAPFTANKTQVNAQVAYGLWTGDSVGELNPYGAGGGLGGGYTLNMGLYIGATLDYFTGESESVDFGFGSVESHLNMSQVSFIGGYDLALSKTFVLRPELAVSHISIHSSVSGELSTQSDSRSALGMTPGVTAVFKVGSLSLQSSLRSNIVYIGDTNASGVVVSCGAGTSF
jgi:hypothetical protein